MSVFDISGGSDLPTPPKANVRLDLSQTTDLECSNCGSKFFHMAYMFKKISALISPTGKDSIVPIETFACLECGNINKEFLPRNVNDNDIKLD
jgi:DNA-directed RNA polymerase subunit RPC12/RpoP